VSATDPKQPPDPAAFAEHAARICGAAHVDFSSAGIAAASRTTAPWRSLIAGIVRPSSTDEVASLVKAAAATATPLYPVSTGKNWGYGDRLPAGDNQVVLDLGRMNRIIEVDEALAYAIVEPGVTQGQLFEHLQARQLALWLDCTGAGPDAGVIGNILERGFGHTPLGDRFRAISGIEAVLGDGSILRTGFAGAESSAVGATYPHGLGPVLDGLFSQSNLGVVTRMGVWLMPKPPAFAAAIVFIDDKAVIGPVVDRLRPLRLDGTLPSVVHIANDLRLLSGRMGFPHQRAGGERCLTAALRAALNRELEISPWAMSAGLYGSRRQIRASAARLKAALNGLPVRIRVLGGDTLRQAERVAGFLNRLKIGRGLYRQIEDAAAAIGLLQGKPTRHFLQGAYWRHPSMSTGNDPALDGCGLLWIAPVSPHRGQDIDRLLALTEPLFARHGFDALLTLSLLNGRAIALVSTLAFNAEDQGEAQAAAACYEALLRATTAAGYPPYRLASGAMAAAIDPKEPYWQAVARLKAALDPAGVIAPGRYAPL